MRQNVKNDKHDAHDSYLSHLCIKVRFFFIFFEVNANLSLNRLKS